MNYLLKFPDGTLKPQDLLTFTPEYLQQKPLLQEKLKGEFQQNSILTVKRLDLHKGTFTTRYIHGTPIKITDDDVTLHVSYASTSKSNDDDGKTEINRNMVFRFDSFLGEIPVYDDATVPCVLNETSNKEYADFIAAVVALLKSKQGTDEKFNFIYHNKFSKEVSEYYFHGTVIEANSSNVVSHIEFSHGHVPHGDYSNTIPRTAARPYLTPETMLIAIA